MAPPSPSMPAWTPVQHHTITVAARCVSGRSLSGLWSVPALDGPLLAALVVSGWHESRLGTYDGGDGGLSWGPWQAHTTRGVGRGHRPLDLQRAEYSCPLMLRETVLRDGPGVLSGPLLSGATLQEWVGLWVAEVERPGMHKGVEMSRYAVGRQRSQTVRDWWGRVAAQSVAFGWQP